MAAFLARADRSSGVMVTRERLPPILPPFADLAHDLAEDGARLRVHADILARFRSRGNSGRSLGFRVRMGQCKKRLRLCSAASGSRSRLSDKPTLRPEWIWRARSFRESGRVERRFLNTTTYFAVYPMTSWVERQNVVQCNQQDDSRGCGSLRKDRTEFVVPDINRSPKAALVLASRTLVQE